MSRLESASGVKSIASLKRGLEVLRAIDRACAGTFSELQMQTVLPKATLARVLKTLGEAGWIRHHARTGRYSLVPGASVPSSSTASHARLSGLSADIRVTLQRRIPWPTDLGIRDGAAMLSVDGPYAGNGMSANFSVLGSRPSMLRSSLGRCYLSFCSEDDRKDILAALARSRVEADRAGLHPDELRRMIAMVRHQGYATRSAAHASVDSPERFGALAVPVLRGDHAVACICVVWIPAIATEEQIVHNYLAPLRDAADALGEKIRRAGWAPDRA